MDKQYYPVEIEEKWVKIWAERKVSNKESDDSFSQVIPPPNVTGTLHMGHSFQYAIMDFYTRYHHMSGKDSYWQVGSDHAGIATQMVVENNLAKKDISRLDLGREKFLKEVWSWKEFSEEKITSQIKRLGNTVDWDKYRFTLDDGCNEAVIKAFVELHRKNKIYRGYRLVNWDPSLKTAVSDLEVVRQEKDGLLWHIKYPIEDSEDYVIVATTRPETMFGDMAVAVNPNDDRYKNLIGKNIVLPFVGRKIPVLADEYVDMEFGTGCLKITPGHDFNDYEIGKKYSLHEVGGEVKTSDTASDFEPLNIFTEDAWSNENVPEPFSNLDRFKVRKLVLEKLKELNLLEKEEKHHISVPRGERSNVVIEPRLSYQWYVKTKDMAARANDAVNKGEIQFHPENWIKTYFNWMDNIEDWCISRQIWWGHRIPAWYDEDSNVYVGYSEEEVRQHYKLDDKTLTQDEDVLDTWFSSSLWPFASLGWPNKTEDYKKHFRPRC
jgi:valyl-tRNA synthetase